MKRSETAKLWASNVGPVVLYVGLIFALSSLPQAQLPSAVRWFSFPNSDKVMHFIEYTGLGALLLRALHLGGRGLSMNRALLAALLAGALCGGGDELYQSIVPTRDSSWSDWMADMLGVAVGSGAYRCALGWWRTSRPMHRAAGVDP